MFQVGDLVKVREDLLPGEDYDNVYFAPEMSKYRGKFYEINGIVKGFGFTLNINLDNMQNWTFSPSMLELIPQNIDLNDFERMLFNE